MLRRECFVFSDTVKEFDFTKLYVVQLGDKVLTIRFFFTDTLLLALDFLWAGNTCHHRGASQ